MDSEDVKRRIEAGRILRGIDQVAMDRLGHAEGLGKQELGRLERGKLPFTRVHRDVLCRVLRLPAWWFTAETISFSVDPPALEGDRLVHIEERLGNLEDMVTQGLEQLEQALSARTDAVDALLPGVAELLEVAQAARSEAQKQTAGTAK